MQGLVLYNGSSKTLKVKTAALKVCEELSKKNINMQSVKNNEILNSIDENNNSKLVFPEHIKRPDFVVAWDKDTKLIEMIENMGIKTFNPSSGIKCCDDKSLMHLKLVNSGISIPKTIVSPLCFSKYDFSKEYYNRIVDQLGENFILKEDFGSFGMQVYQITNFENFIEVTNGLGNRGFILQENIKSSKGRDLRISIVGEQVIGAMLRENKEDFRANITLGGTATMYDANDAVLELALKAHKALGLYFSGVDILFGEDNMPMLCEVNSNPNFLSFEKISGINFAQKIAEFIVGEI